MSTIDALTIGAHISFDLYPAAIIGTTFNNVEVTDILSFSTAMLFADVASMHANVFPTLLGSPVNDPKKYLYVKVRLENGNEMVLGIPWIKESSIVTNTTQNMTLTVLSVNPINQARAKEVLVANGFTIANVTLS